MNFGGLSKEELKKVEIELLHLSIKYTVIKDAQMLESNKTLARDPLQYLNLSNTSSARVLGVLIEDEVLEKLNSEVVTRLNELGLYWGESPFEFVESVEDIPPPMQLVTSESRKSFARFYLFGTGLLVLAMLIEWAYNFFKN